jgi:hypothetical protein
VTTLLRRPAVFTLALVWESPQVRGVHVSTSDDPFVRGCMCWWTCGSPHPRAQGGCFMSEA